MPRTHGRTTRPGHLAAATARERQATRARSFIDTSEDALPGHTRSRARMASSSAPHAPADSRDVFLRRWRTTPAPAGYAYGAAVGVTDVASDAATPSCAKQTTPAFVQQRASVLRCRDARLRRRPVVRPPRSAATPAPASVESSSRGAAIAFHDDERQRSAVEFAGQSGSARSPGGAVVIAAPYDVSHRAALASRA